MGIAIEKLVVSVLGVCARALCLREWDCAKQHYKGYSNRQKYIVDRHLENGFYPLKSIVTFFYDLSSSSRQVVTYLPLWVWGEPRSLLTATCCTGTVHKSSAMDLLNLFLDTKPICFAWLHCKMGTWSIQLFKEFLPLTSSIKSHDRQCLGIFLLYPKLAFHFAQANTHPHSWPWG